MQISLRLALLALALHHCLAQDPDAGYNREPLKALTEFRMQHRKTIDGRLCAAAFVQDDETYTDCTDARAPDGSAGREWCYVEVQLLGKGPVDWHYCTPAIDYNKVTAKAREAFELKAAEVERMEERLDAQENRLQDMLRRFNATCGIQHQTVGGRIDKIETMISRGHHCLQKIEESISKTALLKSTIEQVEEDAEQSQKSSSSQPENCAAVPGYEGDPEPDGITGAYYSGPMFEGAPRGYRDDRAINFVFSGKSPLEGVPPQKFSIRWDGYILAPSSGKYVFSTETGCGARVFLSGKAIIVDRMPEVSEGEQAVPLIAASEKAGVHKTDSAPQELVGGQKYKLRVEMIHSSHLKYENPETAVMKLYWHSGSIEEQVIPYKYFYKTNIKSNVRISGLDGALFDVTFLNNGEYAFKDSKTYFVADVPPRHEGRRFIRTVADVSMDEFTVSVNTPAVIYIASSMGEPSPLGPPDNNRWKAHDTEESMSVYRGTSLSERALESRTYGIQFMELPEGGDRTFKVVHKHQPFIIFVEQRKEEESTCGGEEEAVSLVGHPAYEGCEASSQESDDYGCEAALNGKHMDQKNGVWRSVGGNGVGEFIVVKFKKPVQITEFRFKPRDDSETCPESITLSFAEEGGDNSETFSILHSNKLAHNTYRLKKPVITKYVKAEVTGMYISSEDTGGSLDLVGTQCSIPESETKKLGRLQEVNIERCDTTVENIPEVLPLEDGQQFVALCPSHCVKSPEGRVFGMDIYAPDSTLCAASVHAGQCLSEESTCRVLVTVNGHREGFAEGIRNGVRSVVHGASEVSLAFSEALSSPKPDDESIKYAVSFKPKSISLPAGYQLDTGGVKQQHDNNFYGWLRPAKADSCFEEHLENTLTSGGILFPPATASEECKTEGDCSANFWSLTLRDNGIYRLQVQVGSPCEPPRGTRTYYLEANGHRLVDGIPLQKGQYYVAVSEVDITDKLLMLTSTCDASVRGHCKSAITTILNMKIEKISNLLPEGEL